MSDIKKNYKKVVSKYWQKTDSKINASVPNETLIRLIGNLKFSYKRKKVLDVGIGDGANLIEFKKRGSSIFGIDIRKKKILDFCKKNHLTRKNFYVSDLNYNFPKIKKNFDLIVCKDTFYYLDYNRHLPFLKFCKKILNKKGYFILQFIQAELKEKKKKKLFDYSLSKNFKKETKYHERNNPINILTRGYINNLIQSSKFKLKVNIFDVSTHLKDKKFVTINRYLVLSN